jgi:hypothetical protein
MVLLGQNHQSFVDISDFDGAKSGEERFLRIASLTDLGNFIIGEGDHG